MEHSQGFAALDAMIARLRTLPELIPRAAPILATEIQAELEQTIAAGADPYGNAWPRRKLDGAKALQNAAQALTVRAFESSIYVRLYGPEAKHHLGHGKGRVTRAVIPIDVIPDRMAARMIRIMETLFSEAMSK